MDSQQQGGVALTSFDRPTADAVVAVLGRAGIGAWQETAPDAAGDIVIMVPAGQRDEAMRAMGQRMEEIQAELAGRPAAPAAPPVRDPDDVRDGPPLLMERFADLRVVMVAILGPLLVVTIAGPFLPRQARVVLFVIIGIALAIVLAARRRR